MANCSSRAYDLFDEWVNEPNYSKRMINFLVEQLSSDTYWLNENISDFDREVLIFIGRMLDKETSKGEM